MRVHRLELTAFGPYAGTEVLDFEPLNDAGLFLLTGPTGAGKTTILDALCFALYGVVPGERGTRELRSDHAPVDRRPEVVLDVTVGERRYRVRRSPEWRRPKRRGPGETKEHARATLVELLPDGQERLVSSRAAEVGHELRQTLGMSSEQFLQLALLPQGGFQTFLQASSDERQSVLQKLFHTQRFARIEEWMRERTREARVACGGAERDVTQVLSTLAHRAGSPLPDELAGERLGDVRERALLWAHDQRQTADRAHTTASELHDALLEAEAAARDSDDRVERQRADAERARAARHVLAELDASADEALAVEQSLAAHEEARLVAPLVAGLPALEQRCAAAGTRAAVLLGDVDDRLLRLPSDLAGGDLDEMRSRLDERLGRLRALLPREEERLTALERRRVLADRCADARRRARAVSERAAELPGRRDTLVREVAELRPLADGLARDCASRREAAEREACAAALPAATAAQQRAVERWRRARDDAADARDSHLDAVERRLAGIAAELAGQLRPGSACHVCGSPDHPRPAVASSHAVTEEQQQEALRLHQRRQRQLEEADDQRRAADREVARLSAGTRGADLDDCAAERADWERRVAAAEAAAERLPRAETALAAATAEERAIAAEQAAADEECRTVEAELLALDAAAAATTAELVAATADLRTGADTGATDGGADPGPWLARLVEQLEAASAAVTAASAAISDRRRLEDRLAEEREAADVAARRHGFPDAAAAAAAVLSPADLAGRQTARAARDEQRRAAHAVLAELAVTGGGDGPEAVTATDRDRSRAALAAAVDAVRVSAGQVGAAAERRRDVARLVEQLDAALAVWEPLRSEREVTESLAGLVRGTSADNQLQVRLSSYVLAARLDQVLAAANDRLLLMRDQRYTLRRCARDGGPGRSSAGRAGLGLELLDAWTGESRPPSTLSGGETFVVSLALALGLADVVAEEAGGLHLGTLFVDEGFGMLDPDTLDDVMDRIDALRAGGRTVGVVSHVTELRARIPTQVHVRAGRDGSRVELRCLELVPA